MKNSLTVVLLGMLFLSCVDNLDFEQIEDYNAIRVYNLAIIHSFADQSRFVSPSGNEIKKVTDFTRFTLFSDFEYARKNVIKTDIDFQLTNQFNRQFTITIDFLRKDNSVAYSFKPVVVRKKTNNVNYKETIEIAKYPSILKSVKIKITLELLPSEDGSVIDTTIPKKIELKSKATVYIKS